MSLRKILSFVTPALVVAIEGFTLITLQSRVNAAATSGAAKTVVIPIEGMSCMSCVAHVKRTLTAMDGIEEVSVDLQRRQATIRYTEGRVTPKGLAEAINKLGYRAGTPQVKDSK